MKIRKLLETAILACSLIFVIGCGGGGGNKDENGGGDQQQGDGNQGGGQQPNNNNPLQGNTIVLTWNNKLVLTNGKVGGVQELTDDIRNFQEPVKAGNLYFFKKSTPETGAELWVTNKTKEGTKIVKDLKAGADHGNPINLTKLNETIIFTAFIDQHHKLYKSDGTESGTVVLKDLSDLKTDILFIYNFYEFKDKLYFMSIGHTDTGGTVWVSDGASNGTKIIIENISVPAFSVGHFFDYKDDLYVTHKSGTQYLLRKLDPTGTFVTVKTFNYNILSIKVVGEKIFLMTQDSDEKVRQFWVSDGTDNGTTKIMDVQNVWKEQKGFQFVEMKSALYFYIASTPDTNSRIISRLYKSDGTSAGTVLVKSGWKASAVFNMPSQLLSHDGKLYFSAGDANSETSGDLRKNRLWVSDGTHLGTKMIKNSEKKIFGPYFKGTVNGKLLFVADMDDQSPRDIDMWSTEGTIESTIMIQDETTF